MINYWLQAWIQHHIQTIRGILGRTKEQKLLLVLKFINFDTVFDSVYFKAVLEALRSQGIENPYIEILANI